VRDILRKIFSYIITRIKRKEISVKELIRRPKHVFLICSRETGFGDIIAPYST
jgi:hypothetical protein